MKQLILSIVFLPLVCSVTLNLNGVTSTTEKSKDYDKNDYGFSYGVSDSNTGDHKTHWEKRENGVVSGAYSLLEPDGSTRLVQYRADNSGFHPLVQKLNQPVQSVSGLQYPSSTSSPYSNPSISNLYNYNRSPYVSNNPPLYPNTGYNYNGRYYFPDTASYRPPLSSFDRGGYYNGYSGYDSSYRGSALRPYNLGNGRVRGQGAPLLHSTYHGYDNLYH